MAGCNKPFRKKVFSGLSWFILTQIVHLLSANVRKTT